MLSHFVDGILTIDVKGHIDSSNAPVFEKDIFDTIDARCPKSVILDLKDLEYISSAGLRVILKLRKKMMALKLINASQSVYEIFDMTGFVEMIEIEKAYREYDVTGCEVVGEGANGKVYRIDRDTIVKVYKNADSLNAIKRERELARTAFVLGIPTAIPYDVVKVGDTYGSVFELLNARSFAELIREDENNFEFVAQKTVEVAKTIHSTLAPATLPRQSDEAKHWLKEAESSFDPLYFKKLTYLIESIPEEKTMLHGDLHVKNLMQQNNETLLIDMDTLSSGHPIYELAFMFNAYIGFGICDSKMVSGFLGIPADTAKALFHRILSLYLSTDDKRRLEEVEEKAAVIGYLRILRRLIRIGDHHTESGKKLFRYCKNYIELALDHLDTLDF